MSFMKDLCSRCMTTHPLNDDGERVCPKPPSEEKSDGPVVIYKGGGWYHKDKRVIKTPADAGNY
jgi:acetyl esterase/lipase